MGKDEKAKSEGVLLDRGTENRGVFPMNEPSEDLSSILNGKSIPECTLKVLDEFSGDLSKQQIRKLVYFSSWYNMIGYDKTHCLFKIARVVWDNLRPIYYKDKDSYYSLVKTLVDIRKELIRRTQKPYKLSFDTQPREALPKWILEEDPFNFHKEWDEILKYKGKVMLSEAIFLEKDKEATAVKEKELQDTLDKLSLNLEKALVNYQIETAPKGDSPLVKRYTTNLSVVTLDQVLKQTGATMKNPYSGDKLIERTELILYHSVFSILLDKEGNPTTLSGLFDYPILLPSHKSQMKRHMQPPGLYISVAKYGNLHFKLEGMNARKILLGGITGFEEYGYGYSGPHEFQDRLIKFMESRQGYLAVIVADSAIWRNELTLDSLKSTLPDLVEAAIPYTLKEIEKKLEENFENYQEVLKDIGKEILKAILIAELKERVVKFLVKKIGVKVIPVIGAVASAVDLITGDYEYIRHAIAYVILAVKGKQKDDMTIAAKGVSKIMANELESEVIGAVVKNATSRGIKMVKKAKGAVAKKGKDPAAKTQDKPAEQTKPAKADDTDLNKALNQKSDQTAKDTPKPTTQKKPAKQVHTKAGDRGQDFDPSVKDQVMAQRKNEKKDSDDKKKPVTHVKPVKSAGEKVKETPAYKKLKQGGLEEVPYPDYFLSQPFGEYQKQRTGNLDHDYKAKLKNGKTVQIDGIAESDVKGKVDIIETKFENPYITLENIGDRSAHLKFNDKKGDQLERLARYADENPDSVGKVKVLCSQQTAAETYNNILHQQVPEKYHKHIEIVEDDEPFPFNEFKERQRQKRIQEKIAEKEKAKADAEAKNKKEPAKKTDKPTTDGTKEMSTDLKVQKEELKSQRAIDRKIDKVIDPKKKPDPDKPKPKK